MTGLDRQNTTATVHRTSSSGRWGAMGRNHLINKRKCFTRGRRAGRVVYNRPPFVENACLASRQRTTTLQSGRPGSFRRPRNRPQRAALRLENLLRKTAARLPATGPLADRSETFLPAVDCATAVSASECRASTCGISRASRPQPHKLSSPQLRPAFCASLAFRARRIRRSGRLHAFLTHRPSVCVVDSATVVAYFNSWEPKKAPPT